VELLCYLLGHGLQLLSHLHQLLFLRLLVVVQLKAVMLALEY
jgi:hypothetical protein